MARRARTRPLAKRLALSALLATKPGEQRRYALAVRRRDGILRSVAHEVKFALGDWDGLCSATWKVWPGNDGSVYIADRNLGAHSKVSLHPRDATRPGREWRIAFTSS